MKKDCIYQQPKKPVPAFAFNAEVAGVFDDMIRRSVPMYPEIIRRQAQMIAKNSRPGMRIYDLGCSTGNLALELASEMPSDDFELIAADTSAPMLEIAARNWQATGSNAMATWHESDIRCIDFAPADVVVCNFTLQFIPPADRQALLHQVSQALVPGGLLLFSEKIVHDDVKLRDLQIDFYYRFKRENGYSELEISQKREALENVLIPETVEEHHRRLEASGLTRVDLWLKWFNFCSWICIR